MTVNSRFGTKVAVLAGDFLFAQSSWFLANLDNLEVSTALSVSCVLAVLSSSGQGQGVLVLSWAG
jgi:geranylgeranyl pyrophosphate synthase